MRTTMRQATASDSINMASDAPNDGTGQGEQLNRTDEMMDTGISPQAPLTTPGMELEGPSQPSLPDFQGMTGCSTALAFDCSVPCTASGDQTCDLLMQLSTWNEFLFPARLQLRDASGARSELCLATWSTPGFENPRLGLPSRAFTCAYSLLKSHRCIVALDLSLEILGTWKDLLFEALKGNSSVRYLKISAYTLSCCDKLSAVIPSMNRIEELHFGYGEGTPLLHSAFSTILHCTVSLRVLEINLLSVQSDASVLLRGLYANSTLKELSLHETVLDSVSPEHRADFTKYLEECATLTTFGYSGGGPTVGVGSNLNCVLYGLLRNKTIRNLSLAYFILRWDSTTLITNLLEVNECLRSFNMISTQVSSDVYRNGRKHLSFILALARSKNLEEITLPLRLCRLPRWRQFFAALQSNANRIKVVLNDDIDSTEDFSDICQALRESGMDDRVSVSTSRYIQDVDLLKCKGLSRLTLFHAMSVNSGHLHFLHQMLSCNHITSLRLVLVGACVKEALFTAFAKYVETATTLKELCLLHAGLPRDPVEDMTCWKLFTNSLSRNTSIREVGIVAFRLGKEASVLLADVLRYRTKTWSVEFTTEASAPRSAFVRRLSVGIGDNYNLLRATLRGWIDPDTVRDWFAVQDTVRRNSGLLTRAAQFATGSVRNRIAAQALERVHSHPALPEELGRVGSVESGEAAAMIRRALRSVESMHDFMRLSGVVKERVVCLPRHDGRPQLDDLDEYCWGAVRRYLLLEDVRSCGRPSP